MAPMVEPWIMMAHPTNVSLVLASRILPWILMFCAYKTEDSVIKMIENNNLKFIVYQRLLSVKCAGKIR
jgi:hypothetical protein